MKVSRRIGLLILMVVIGIAPFVSVALAGLIAEWNGCVLHEGFAGPCIVFGTDIGGVLYTMTVMGWLMLISLMFLAGGLLGLVWECVLLLGRRILRR